MNSKVCEICGRSFEFRKKWEKNWDQIKYCSDRCRKFNSHTHKEKAIAIEEKILALLKLRGKDKSICPSEVLPDELKTNKSEMELVRQVARSLAHSGKIIITQKNQKVSPDEFRGPIRLKLS